MVRTPPGSLREGAGDELHYPSDCPETATLRAFFIAPKVFAFFSRLVGAGEIFMGKQGRLLIDRGGAEV